MSCMCECLSPPTASGVVPPLSTEALWCCVFTGFFPVKTCGTGLEHRAVVVSPPH